MNIHAPVANTTVEGGDNVRNANALFRILRPYKVHIFQGIHIIMKIHCLLPESMSIISGLRVEPGGQAMSTAVEHQTVIWL